MSALLPTRRRGDRRVRLVGGPGDGEIVRVGDRDYGRWIPSAIEWDEPELVPVRALSGSGRALYLRRVTEARSPHPCLAGTDLVAEWDVYTWTRPDSDVDPATLGPPHRFRVVTR